MSGPPSSCTSSRARSRPCRRWCRACVTTDGPCDLTLSESQSRAAVRAQLQEDGRRSVDAHVAARCDLIATQSRDVAGSWRSLVCRQTCIGQRSASLFPSSDVYRGAWTAVAPTSAQVRQVGSVAYARARAVAVALSCAAKELRRTSLALIRHAFAYFGRSLSLWRQQHGRHACARVPDGAPRRAALVRRFVVRER